ELAVVHGRPRPEPTGEPADAFARQRDLRRRRLEETLAVDQLARQPAGELEVQVFDVRADHQVAQRKQRLAGVDGDRRGRLGTGCEGKERYQGQTQATESEEMKPVRTGAWHRPSVKWTGPEDRPAIFAARPPGCPITTG